MITRNYGDDEFRFNDATTHEGHLRQNGILTSFDIETAKKRCRIIKSEITWCIKGFKSKVSFEIKNS